MNTTILLAVLGPAMAVHAQTVRFLIPASFAPAPGAANAIGFATPFEPVAWPAGRVEWLFERAGGTQGNRHAIEPAPDARTVSLQPFQVGACVVGADLAAATENVGAEVLGEFLVESASAGPPPPKVDPVPVRRWESAAAILRAAGAGQPSPVATNKSGLRAEIRPLMDPTVLPPGADLPVRLYVNGDKLAGGVVLARCGADTHRITADPSGIALIPLSRAGEWRLEFHRPAVEPEGFALYTGTLSFQVPEAEGER